MALKSFRRYVKKWVRLKLFNDTILFKGSQMGHSVKASFWWVWWGRCEKRKKEGRVEKKARAARPVCPGLEPGSRRVLGEGP